MWIRDVNFPAALVSDFRAGHVVLFVGAGASVAPPAGLPTFVALARQIGTETHQAFDEEEVAAHPDVVLGRFQDEGVDIHHLIKRVIGNPESGPNDLHRAIAGLAAAGPSVRIVTTNYDLHLSTALRDLGASFAEYRGPAVPMGDDFDGIVYLHGDLTQEPRHLIATEGDLGRAYLTDAWAARFVERMFAKYTVLFIGYSHSDVVMRLIARGIGRSRQRRYALTHQADSDVWKTYSAVPIGYEAVDRSHAALHDALNGWATLMTMDLLEHRQRIARLISAPPSLVPEDDSYLEDVLGDPDRVRLFAELAEGPQWLPWAAQRPQFQAMFRPDAEQDVCTGVLAGWFVERFAMVEAHTAKALTVLYDGGSVPAPVLCAALGQHMHRRRGPRPAWLGPWLAVLIQHAGEADTRWLEYALRNSEQPEDRAAALLLFETLTEPRLRQRHWYAGQAPSFEIALRGSVYHLDQAWREVFEPVLAGQSAQILSIVDRQLRRACTLLTVAGTTRPGWDPVSFGRYTIRPGTGDDLRQPVDVLIDAARNCIEALLAAGGPAGPGYLDTWATSDIPVLQRLALHGWAYRTDVDATAKLAWLRITGWLFEHQLRPEVYHLIAEVLPAAAAAESDGLVADALTQPVRGSDDEHIAYLRFNALTWLVQSVPDLSSARSALSEVHAQYPHFEARERPDLFRSPIEVVDVPEQPPMTIDELHEQITTDPSSAISTLRQYEPVRDPFDGPSWSDALNLITANVHDHPEDGLTVLEVAGLPSDIVCAIIDGWSAAPLNPETAVAVLHRIRDLDLPTVLDSVARLLIGGITDSANATKWHLLPQARELAHTAWAALPQTGERPDGGSDWLTRAINRPAGHIAEFWIRAVSADWTAAGDNWDGLPPELSRPLETMLDGAGGPTRLAQTVLAGRLALFFAADRPWCEQFLLPLMTWAGNEDQAVRAWTGYLTIGRITDDLFTALANDYLDTVKLADQLPDDLSDALLGHLAAIAVYSATDPLTWVHEFTARAAERQRVTWISKVAQTLDNLTPEAVEQQWQRWMRQYWRDRLDRMPTTLTFEEASALATWVPYLGQSLAEGVSLATRHTAGLTEHHTLDDWSDQRLAREPTLFARLLAHLLTGTTPPTWEDIRRAALAVRNAAEPADLTTIRNEALRLGLSDAPTW
jgi:AraC-like DNA-binding protein